MSLKLYKQFELQKIIQEHYKNNRKVDIIFKTELALEMGLAVGYNSKELTFRMYDIGVKPEELGLSMALAMKRTDDKYLSELDQKIKTVVIARFSDMLKELEQFELK